MKNSLPLVTFLGFVTILSLLIAWVNYPMYEYKPSSVFIPLIVALFAIFGISKNIRRLTI